MWVAVLVSFYILHDSFLRHCLHGHGYTFINTGNIYENLKKVKRYPVIFYGNPQTFVWESRFKIWETSVPQRELAREALRDRAVRHHITLERSNHTFEIWLALKFVLKVGFVVLQFPFSFNPLNWFRLWEAIDTYLSFYLSGLPVIISGNVYLEEPLHFVQRFRL